MLETKIVSAMEKCFIDQKPSEFAEVKRLRMYRNERGAIQFIAYNDTQVRITTFLQITIEGELAQFATMRTVENVPNYCSARFIKEDGTEKDYHLLRTTPGLYPDVLMPLMRKNCIPYFNQQMHTVIIEFAGDLKAGKYPMKIVLHDLNNEKVAENAFEVEVIDAFMPNHGIKFSNWFYADCLADYYNVPAFSDRHFEICENFIKTAASVGINMLLMPVFTPPLDTYIGGERTTTQLVKVMKENGVYSFDFSLVDRWITMCDRCGMKYIEVCQLFSQWGATSAPKIMAYVDGVYQQIFGWDTDATGREYVAFLRQFLTEFTGWLEKRGDKGRTYFHLSDEPRPQHLETYKTHRKNLRDILEGWNILDGIHHVEFYKEGLSDIPVHLTTLDKEFSEVALKERWVAYCCDTLSGSNRSLALSNPRTRSLGYQLYKGNADGFMHWGYNFYNNENSYDQVNPFLNPSGYCSLETGGDCHMVYPAQNGTAIESVRLTATRQAFDDVRVFRLCESYYGKERVIAEIEEMIGEIDYFNCVEDAKTMQAIRDRMDELIIAKL